jgi:hypothetical protein
MKKFLLLAAAALMVSTAGAQLKTAVPQSKAMNAKAKITALRNHAHAQKLNISEISTMKEMKTDVAAAKNVAPRAPQKAGYIEPFYKRPAGMYFSPFIAVDGSGFYSYGTYSFMMMKPFADYTFEGVADGADESTNYAWDVWIRGDYYAVDDVQGVTFSSYFAADDVPIFYAIDGDPNDPNAGWFDYQIKNYDNEEGLSGAITTNSETPAILLSIPYSEMYEEGVEFMYSSKTMVDGGRNCNFAGSISRYYGAEPWGNNEYGWWFGKNASHIDGLAQAFEKPTRPYMLKNVYLQAYGVECNAPVKMTCKVYKLDAIPEYIDEKNGVSLPIVPGELIVTGEGMVTPTTEEDKNGLITFTLFGQDEDDPELVYEYTPTIDYPILVCIEGYNDEGMEDLVNFSAFVSLDDAVDEGYGELAYLKTPYYETVVTEEGDTVSQPTGEYYWHGLNNFFSSGTLEMKTGLTIFIGTENPFITFNYGLEDGEYTFPNEGGEMVKYLEYEDTTVVCNGIEFFSYTPSEDGDWTLTWKGTDELPEWLNIELADGEEDGEFSGLVYATVTADPLPAGVAYREAVIRFEIPGDYLDYKFMQGEKQPWIKGDVNGDGEVNIADINALIDVILGGNVSDETRQRADVNGDGEINIADINSVIDIILS